VEAPALAGEQVVVRHLAEQGVAEGIALGLGCVGVDDQDLARDRIAQGGVEVVDVQPIGGLGEEVVIDAATGGGHDAHDGSGGFGQRPEPRGEDLLQRRREAGAPLPGLGQHQLLDEEGVAIRPAVEARRDHGRRRLPGDRGEHRRRLLGVEAREVDPADAARPLELADPGHRGMPPMELVRSQGHRHDHGLGAQGPDEEPEGLAVAGSAQWTSSAMTSTGADSDRRGAGRRARQEACLRNSRWIWAADDDGSSAARAGEVGAGRPDEGRARRLHAPRDLREDLDDGAVREPLVADAGARAAKDAHAARRRSRSSRRAASCRRRPRP
jgi:hypothetical protein